MDTTGYAVEIMTAPVLDDDWTLHEEVLDLLPGTLLIQDPIEPSLIFYVETEYDAHAYLFVSMIASVVGIPYTKICVSVAERLDFEYAEEDYAEAY